MFGIFRVRKFDTTFTFQPRGLRGALAASLVGLVFAPSLLAQEASSGQPFSGTALYINVIAGDDAMNNIHDRTVREPVVQVTDAHDRPVRGVTVLFTEMTGAAGAGAAFGAQQTYTTVTGTDGEAVARGFRPNQILGKHSVKVDATAGTIAGATTIHETNVEKDVVAVATAGGVGGGAALASVLPKLLATGSVATGAVVGVFESFRRVTPPVAVTAPIPNIPASVPEIDLSMTLGGLMLLAGSAAVLRGR